jgi:hypothetical protein
MEVAELIRKRETLEFEIGDFLQPLIDKFHNETGVAISRIDVDLVNVSTRGDPSNCTALGPIHAHLKI